MVNFTLTETVDIILPLAPEKLYEAEETPISLWTLALYSLTKDENLDVLPYHAALQQLRPFVVETRGEYVLLRGLNLQEMQGLAAK